MVGSTFCYGVRNEETMVEPALSCYYRGSTVKIVAAASAAVVVVTDVALVAGVVIAVAFTWTKII